MTLDEGGDAVRPLGIEHRTGDESDRAARAHQLRRNIQHMVRYTAANLVRFERL